MQCYAHWNRVIFNFVYLPATFQEGWKVIKEKVVIDMGVLLKEITNYEHDIVN